MKHLFRSLLSACCFLAAFSCSNQQNEQFKLVSYNIRNGIGIDNVRDLDRTAATINGLAPDVVALQEVDSMTNRSGHLYIPGELARRTGMHALFGRAIEYDGGGYGIGLLARTEPLAVRRIPLPGREEERLLLIAEFPEYFVCVTHLSLTPEDRTASLPLIRQATDTCNKPALLAGDFNIENAAAIAAGLEPAFRFLSDTTQATFPSDTPQVCIDYILGRNLPSDFTVERYAVEHASQASDHCPILIVLNWGKQAPNL